MSNTWSADDQRKLKLGKGNACWLEVSEVAFATTGLTVEVGTTLDSQVLAMAVFPKATPSPYETFYSDGVITTSGITLTRQTVPVHFGTQIDAAALSSYNFTAEAVAVIPTNGTVTRISFYNKTKAGGTPLLFLGTNRCYKTGLTYTHATKLITGSAADFNGLLAGDSVYVSGTNITSGFAVVSAVAADGSTITVTGLVSTNNNTDAVVTTRNTLADDIAAPATGASTEPDAPTAPRASVRAGDVIVFGTTSAASSNPAGTLVALEVTPEVTSALEVNAFVYGL